SYWALGDFADAAVAASTIADAGRRLNAIVDHIPADAPTRLTHLVSYAKALLTDRDDGEALLGAALADPAGEQWPVERVRLLIAHAAVLRRHRRRSEAQQQLSRALAIAHRLDAGPLIDLCHRDLRAAGIRPVPAATDPPLSPQEHQVVYLAGLGWTNPQIAARLQLSTRTISNHLYRSFPKLGITRRQQIRDIPPPGGLGPVETVVNG
ncbi:MAG: helix-turn-helix transcriptional regulator, partial [Mycobacterium sp.]